MNSIGVADEWGRVHPYSPQFKLTVTRSAEVLIKLMQHLEKNDNAEALLLDLLKKDGRCTVYSNDEKVKSHYISGRTAYICLTLEPGNYTVIHRIQNTPGIHPIYLFRNTEMHNNCLITSSSIIPFLFPKNSIVSQKIDMMEYTNRKQRVASVIMYIYKSDYNL